MKNDSIMDEAEKLIWAQLDERIVEADTQRLEGLVKENEQIRNRYLEISKIHTDLYDQFSNSPSKSNSPVLSFLGDYSAVSENSASLTD